MCDSKRLPRCGVRYANESIRHEMVLRRCAAFSVSKRKLHVSKAKAHTLSLQTSPRVKCAVARRRFHETRSAGSVVTAVAGHVIRKKKTPPFSSFLSHNANFSKALFRDEKSRGNQKQLNFDLIVCESNANSLNGLSQRKFGTLCTEDVKLVSRQR